MRNLRAALSLTISAALLLLSPGLSSYNAVAAEFEGPAGRPVVAPVPAVNANLGRTLSVPGAGLEIPKLDVPSNLQLPGAEIPAAGNIVAPAANLVLPQANPEAAPGAPAAAEASLGKLSETLQPQLEAASSQDNADPRGTGETIERLLEGRETRTYQSGAVLPAADLPNPYGLYRQAYPAAVAQAEKMGKSPAQVHFYEATASVPGVDGASWKFAFYLTDAKTGARVGDIVYVDFRKAGLAAPAALRVSDDPHVDSYMAVQFAGQSKFEAPRSFTGSYEAPRVSVYKNAPLAADWVPFTADPTYVKMGSQTNAQAALETARHEGLTGGVSVSFKLREEPVSGDKDYWYHFYDNKGNVFASNGRSNEVRWIQKAAAAPESPSARLGRFVSRGQGVGVVAGIIAAAAIWHGATHMDITTDIGFKASLMAMLITPAVMLLSAVGLTKLGGWLGGLLSGVKPVRVAPPAPPAVAPAKIETPKPVVVEEKKPAAPSKRQTHEAAYREAGEWIGGLLTVASAFGAYLYGTTLVAAAAQWSIIIVPAFPFAGLAFILGGAAIGSRLGRRADAGLKPGVFASGALAGLGTIGAAALVAFLTPAAFFQTLVVLAALEAVFGAAALAAVAIHSGAAPDLKSDGIARLGAKALVSAGVSGTALMGLAGWLYFAFAGTIKDKAGAPVFPMHDGPAPLYAQAAAAAIKAAQGKGYSADQLYLGSMEAGSPLDAKKGWTVQFIGKKTPEASKGEVINAYLYPEKEGAWRASAYAYGEAELGDAKLLKFMTDIRRATPKNLGDALTRAAKALKVEPAELGFTLQPWREADAWGTDLAYVFDTADGRRWAINARTGKKLDIADTGVSVARIEAAAKSVASYKGRPWSQTEYNMTESMTADSLRRDGASPAQMRLFQKLCDEAPVRAGGFNPWSGD